VPKRTPLRRALTGPSALVAALGLSACQAKRLLIVTSDPPGAQVLLDGVELGTTPLEEPFVHYGTRRLTFYLEGYLTWSDVVAVKPPWYGRFPFDLVSEILVPMGWRDEHRYHAELEQGRGKIDEPDLESVLRRADTLRTAGPEGPRPEAPALREDTHP